MSTVETSVVPWKDEIAQRSGHADLPHPDKTSRLPPVWDPDAEKLHKIAREELYANGRTPIEIADRMSKALAGRELFSDHPLDDERWWFMIWQASGVSTRTTGDLGGICTIEPTFEVRQLKRPVMNRIEPDLEALTGKVVPVKHFFEK